MGKQQVTREKWNSVRSDRRINEETVTMLKMIMMMGSDNKLAMRNSFKVP